jgi:hypothetical protein
MSKSLNATRRLKFAFARHLSTPVAFASLALFATALGTLGAQEPTFAWAKKLESNRDARTGVVDTEGNYAMVSSSGPAFAVAKLDPQGEVLWKRGLPKIWKLAAGPDGSVYVAGSLVWYSAYSDTIKQIPLEAWVPDPALISGSGSAYVAKLARDGTVQWLRRFGELERMEAEAIAVNPDGSYYVAGFYAQGAAQIGNTTLPKPSGKGNLFIAKFSSDGSAEWARAGTSLDGDSAFGGSKLISVASGGVLFIAPHAYGGFSFGELTTYALAPIIKLDPNGKVLWTIESDTWLRVAQTDPSGNIYVADSDFAFETLKLSKYDSGGALLWSREVQADSPIARWTGVAVDSQGNCFAAGVVGVTQIPFGDSVVSTSSRDMFVVKYSPSGEVRWVIQSKGQTGTSYASAESGGAEPSGVAVSSSGVIFMAGTTSRSVQFGSTTLTGAQWIPNVFVARILDPDNPIAPPLEIGKQAGGLRLRWPVAPEGYVLESATALSGGPWSSFNVPPKVDGDQNLVVLQPETGGRFFRLRKP